MTETEVKIGDKIVILGGSGHLGSSMIHHMVNQLNFNPSDIRVFYLAGSPTNSLNDIEGLEMFPGNILEINDVRNACLDREFIFHMIGNTTFDPRQKELQWKVNVEGTRNVLDVCVESNVLKRLCYTSTINTLGLPNPIGSIGNYEDCSPYNSKNKMHTFNSPKDTLAFIDKVKDGTISNVKNKIGIGYFDSKLAAQELVNKYHKEFNLNVVSILPGTMFGPYDYLIGTGMYIITIYNNMVPGILKGGMTFMHVMDCVKGQLLAMKKAKTGTQYIISGKKEDNLYLIDLCKIVGEVLRERSPNKKIKIPKIVFNKSMVMFIAFISETISNITNKPNPLTRDAVRAGSVPTFYSYEAAKKDLGYEPEQSVREAIGETFDYYKKENMLAPKTRYLDRR